MMINFTFGQNLKSIPQPYLINSSDHDTLLLLKRQVNGCLKKLELAKKDMMIFDSLKYQEYEKRMLKNITILINEIKLHEDR